MYSAIETPRGELGTYIIGGGDQEGGVHPTASRSGPPSLHAMAALPYALGPRPHLSATW